MSIFPCDLNLYSKPFPIATQTPSLYHQRITLIFLLFCFHHSSIRNYVKQHMLLPEHGLSLLNNKSPFSCKPDNQDKVRITVKFGIKQVDKLQISTVKR